MSRIALGSSIVICAQLLHAGEKAPDAWPAGVDATGRHLADREGKPFFWLGDTAWMLFQAPGREDVERYLSARARQGFTVIQAAAVMGEERVAGTARPNAHGDTAFIENDPARPKVTPGKSPDSPDEYDYWDHADHIVDRAASHGLVIGLLPLFVGHGGDGYKYLTPSNAHAYGKFLGERWRAKPNIIWILGGDNVPESEEKKDLWNRVARGITEAVTGSEDHGKTLMTYHSPGGTSSSKWFHASPWLDFNMLQTWSDQGAIAARIAADHGLSPVKPAGLGEGAYENGPQYGFKVDALSIRNQACWSYFSGGYHTYGNTNVWNFGTYKPEATEDWKSALDSPGAVSLGVVRKVLESLAWSTFVPDASVFAEPTRDLAMLSREQNQVLAYLRGPGSVSIRMEKIAAAKKVKAAWIDPRTGDRIDAGSFDARGSSGFTAPERWEDAILLLDGR